MLKQAVKRMLRDNAPALPIVFFCYRLKRKILDAIHLALLPLVWMDESIPERQGLLRKGRQASSYGPRYINGPEQCVVTIHEPDVYYRLFHNARISALSSSVVLNNSQLLVERAGRESHLFDYAAGHVLMHGPKFAVVKMGNAEIIDNGIFLGGNGAHNYYHWLIEIAAKGELLPGLPAEFQDYPLLVSEHVRQIPSFKASCEKLLSNRKLIYLNKDLTYAVRQLVWIDAPNNLPFNLVDDRRLDASFFQINRESIRFLQQKLLEGESNDTKEGASPKRIFFCRKARRRGCNEDEILACLETYGFVAIDMGELSFQEQIATIRNADFIAGPTGAAWTNLIFCRPGTQCLCWMAEELGDFAAFSNIANAVGVNLEYLTGRLEPQQRGRIYHQKYRIDIAALDAYLSRHIKR